MSNVDRTNQISQTLAGLGGRKKAETDKNDMGEVKTRFLTMLTTQLKNQDPMNPMKNAEVTSQLAQMSTVDGIQRLNNMFEQFVNKQSDADSLRAAALVGRGVLVPGKSMVLTKNGAIGGFDLPQDADRVNVGIYDANGIEVAKMTFDQLEAGSHKFAWDGKALNGEQAAQGQYSIKVSAEKDGEKVNAKALEFGVVSSVVRGPKSVDLQIGNLGIFKFNDVKQIL